MTNRQCAAVLVVATMLLASGAVAQTVRGQVVDSAGTPVGAGFVVLVDADAREVLRTLTTRNGRFAITIPAGARGPLRIRSERIGYRVAYSTPIAGARAQTFDVQLTVARLPVRLATIEVQDESQCRVRPDEAVATSTVWEEARKALEAASWTASQELYSFEHVRYERTLGARRRRIERQSFAVRTGRYRTPFTSRHPALLATEGYVTDEGPDRWYFAPDAEVLQSSSFLDTHCFHVVRDAERARQSGLGFVPIPGRRLTDIRGTLWLDEETSELRTLDFSYTDVPNRPTDERIGGRIDFRPVPSGAWIVHEWEIRMPRLATNTINVGYERRQDTVITGFFDVGGEVVRIASLEGEVLYEAPTAVVAGRVTSRDDDRAPLSDVVVRLFDTDYADTTDPAGRYEIRIPAAGRFALQLTHPELRSLGYIPSLVDVDLVRGERRIKDLELPSGLRVLDELCETPMGANQRAIVGVARDASTGRPYPGTHVLAQWKAFQDDLTRVWDVEAEASADSLGHFVLCGIEVGRVATLHARYANRISSPVQILFEEREAFVGDSAVETGAAPVLKLDVHLRPAADVETLVTGVVTDAASGHALRDALIIVIGTGINHTTDATGTFRIAGIPPGSITMVIRLPGYDPKRYDFVLRPGGVIELPLEAVALSGGTNERREE